MTSALSAAHPDDIYAIDLAWSDELAVTTDGDRRDLDVRLPERRRRPPTGPVWYPLPERQVASEPGTFLVRASLADGVTTAPYTATFGVTPAGADAYALVAGHRAGARLRDPQWRRAP